MNKERFCFTEVDDDLNGDESPTLSWQEIRELNDQWEREDALKNSIDSSQSKKN